jgi:ribosomal protein S21
MLKIEVKNGNIERALKELKGKFIKTNVTKECRDRQEFVKKSVKNREQRNKAIFTQNKKNKNN